MLATHLQAALRRRTARPWTVTGPALIGHYGRTGYTLDAPRSGAFLEADDYHAVRNLGVSTPAQGGGVVLPEHLAESALLELRRIA